MDSNSDSVLSQIKRVVVIPAFNEQVALPLLIAELGSLLTLQDAVVVVDDSAADVANLTRQRCEMNTGKLRGRLQFLASGIRGGRGAAIRSGLEFAMTHFPSADFFLECDADGSHRALDVQRVLSSPIDADLLIGSRYLPESRIIGWSLARRAQSRILNWLIPRILRLGVSDVTNGLRRYNRNAVRHLLASKPVSTTFIYLTEEAMILSRLSMRIREIPIIFAERRAGSSSVTFSEIRASLSGLIEIVLLSRKLDAIKSID